MTLVEESAKATKLQLKVCLHFTLLNQDYVTTKRSISNNHPGI
jgi:hypothetical protein